MHAHIRTYIHRYAYIHTYTHITYIYIYIYTQINTHIRDIHNIHTYTHIVASLENNEWKIKFSWVKAHAGKYGNELADRFAKEAARSDNTNYGYNRIPKSAILHEAAEAIRKW